MSFRQRNILFLRKYPLLRTHGDIWVLVPQKRRLLRTFFLRAVLSR